MVHHFGENEILLSEGHFVPVTFISEFSAQTHSIDIRPEISATFSRALSTNTDLQWCSFGHDHDGGMYCTANIHTIILYGVGGSKGSGRNFILHVIFFPWVALIPNLFFSPFLLSTLSIFTTSPTPPHLAFHELKWTPW